MDAVLRWVELHPGLASWVQAFGSIAAIVAAIWIAGSERRYRLRIEKYARKDLIDRAIEAAWHSNKVITNQVEFFSCNYIVRSEVPRFVAVIENAASRVKELTRSPGIDAGIFGNLSEVESALLDVEGLIHQCASTLEDDMSYQVELMKKNNLRVDHAILSLQLSRDSL